MASRKTWLPSWNDTTTRHAITKFVAAVTHMNGRDYVRPEERVAVFDNDGTLWCEKPMPIQGDFIMRRLAEMAESDPALRQRQPWKAAYEKDYAWLNDIIVHHYQGDDSDLNVAAGGILRAFEGEDIETFEANAERFLRTEKHPTLGRPYRDCAFTPMVELLRYLEAAGFAIYIASGGGRDFMRPITRELYGIPPERVIGSTVSLRYQPDGRGGTLVHRAELDFFDDGPEKPVRIWSRIGQRPILAAGNANGDIEMLQFTGGSGRPALRLLLLHDDPDREFDYVAGAERALELAKTQGWTVISAKHDWATVF